MSTARAAQQLATDDSIHSATPLTSLFSLRNPTNHFTFPSLSWQPVVKNWFCRQAYENNDRSCVTPNAFKNDWVLYDKATTITLNIHSVYTPPSLLLPSAAPASLTLAVTARFDAPCYGHTMKKAQFLEPYQDEVSLAVHPDAMLTNAINGYKCSLDDRINKNRETHHDYEDSHHDFHVGLSGGIGIPIPYIHKPVHADLHIGWDYHGPQHSSSHTMEDFKPQNSASPTATYYSASMQQCYYEGRPYQYNPLTPDRSMHWHGNTPDYLSQPAALAKGGLILDGEQTYSIRDIDGGASTFHVDFDLEQQLIGMSIWRWCANYQIVNQAKLRVGCDISLLDGGKITRYSLFSNSQPTAPGHGAIDATTMGPVETARVIKNESWKGVTYNPATLKRA